MVPIFILLGLAIRALAAAILIGPAQAFAWFSPGAEMGLLVAGCVLVIALALPGVPRLMLVALSLMAGTVLANLAPPNPYSLAALATWRQGHFLNFNGLTRWVATLWPFLMLSFLLLSARLPRL